MSEGQDIKSYMRERYDRFADHVAGEVRARGLPEDVWRAAEGVKPALAYYRRRKIETALALGGFAPRASLLDVGCATGDYTFLLARRGFKMTGIDLSPRSVETARAKAEILGLRDIAILQTDAETLDGLPASAFDGVVSFSTLRYLDRLDLALASIRRVLRPGGVAVLDFPNRYSPWFTLLKGRFGVDTHPYDHQYSSGEIAQLLELSGFSGIRVRRILFTSYLTPTPILPLFRTIDLLGEPLPFFNRFAAILVARGTVA